MRILFPVVRHTDVSGLLAPLVRNMAKTFGAKIHVLRVEPLSDQYLAMRVKDAEAWLDGFIAKNFSACPVHKAPVVSGDPVQEILKYIDAQEIDCVVIGTHGRKGLSVLFGSVAKDIVGKSPVPVLSINPHRLTDAFKQRNAEYLARIMREETCNI